MFFYLKLILLRLFQQHYCYNVTGQSQESEGSCKPARIKEVHSKLHSFQASLCTLTATHLTLILGCALFYKPIWQLTVNERGHYADSEDTFLFKIEDSPDTRLGA